MERLPLPEIPVTPLAGQHQQLLLATAADAIDYGLLRGEPFPVQPDRFPPELQTVRASFCTLLKNGSLRGCIGTTHARMPLIRDVAHHAFAAAFRDPRFDPVEADELHDLEIRLSILTPAEPMQIHSLRDLQSQLRPGIDGLILEDGYRSATFLPAVWESLTDPKSFVRALLEKAGLAPRHWSPTLCAYRYTTEAVPGSGPLGPAEDGPVHDRNHDQGEGGGGDQTEDQRPSQP